MSGTVLIYDDIINEGVYMYYTPDNVAHLHEVYIGQEIHTLDPSRKQKEDNQDELDKLMYDDDGEEKLEPITREEAMEYVINGADLILCGCL